MMYGDAMAQKDALKLNIYGQRYSNTIASHWGIVSASIVRGNDQTSTSSTVKSSIQVYSRLFLRSLQPHRIPIDVSSQQISTKFVPLLVPFSFLMFIFSIRSWSNR